MTTTLTYGGGPSPEDVLRDIRQRLEDPDLDVRERRTLTNCLVGALEMFNEMLDISRRARREPGKGAL